MTCVSGHGQVEFRFYRPGALRVGVAGDFNGWNSIKLPMRREDDGWWVAEIELPPGEYQFRYVADGQWYTDYAANGLEPGRFGYNSVLVIPGVRRRRRDLAYA